MGDGGEKEEDEVTSLYQLFRAWVLLRLARMAAEIAQMHHTRKAHQLVEGLLTRIGQWDVKWGDRP